MNRTAHRGGRRWIALLGILAILFQAILFGWHHHQLAPSSHSAQPVVHANETAPLSPATAEDDCDICAALHHLTGAPGEFAALPLPAAIAAVVHRQTRVLVDRTGERGFRARAPPRA